MAVRLDPASDRPIYLQLAEAIEDDILKGIFDEDVQVPSTNELAVLLRINPATAGKGINLLAEAGILYKKRGLGMFVAEGARQLVLQKRRQSFHQDFVLKLLEEAGKLGIAQSEVVEMIERGRQQ